MVVAPAHPLLHAAVVQAASDQAQWDEQLLLLRVSQDRAGAWVQALGRWGSADASAGAPGFRSSAAGAMAGADKALAPGVLAGAAVAYVDDQVTERGGGMGSVQTGRLQVYGRWSLGSAAISASFGGAYDQVDVERSAAPGLVARSLHHGWELGGAAQINWRSNLGGLELDPRAGISYQRLWQNPYSEEGASGFGVAVQAADMQTMRPFVGASAGRSFDLGGGRTLRASADVTWWYELLDRSAHGQLVAQDGTAFTFQGPALGRGGVLAGVGLEGWLSSRAELFADYRIQPKVSNSTVQAATLGLRLIF